MRGLENVRGEFSLTALAYNLRRVLSLVTCRRRGGAATRAKSSGKAFKIAKLVRRPQPPHPLTPPNLDED